MIYSTTRIHKDVFLKSSTIVVTVGYLRKYTNSISLVHGLTAWNILRSASQLYESSKCRGESFETYSNLISNCASHLPSPRLCECCPSRSHELCVHPAQCDVTLETTQSWLGITEHNRDMVVCRIWLFTKTLVLSLSHPNCWQMEGHPLIIIGKS